MSNLSTLANEEARPEMDDMLHDYFQAEMPHPWPTFKTPRPMRAKTPVSFGSRYSGRLALAACIALLVAGYLTLGGLFPSSQGPLGVQKATEDVGIKEKKSGRPKTAEKPTDDQMGMPTPMGNETTGRKPR